MQTRPDNRNGRKHFKYLDIVLVFFWYVFALVTLFLILSLSFNFLQRKDPKRKDQLY